MDEKIQKVLESATRFREYPVPPESLRRFLRLLMIYQPTDLWELIRLSDEYIRIMMGLFEALTEQDCVTIDEQGRLSFTEEGYRFAEHLGVKPPDEPIRGEVRKYEFELPRRFVEILDEIRRIYTEVVPKDDFDQAPLLPEAAVRKAFYITQLGDLNGKDVVTVGDDDLLSLIFAMTGEPHRVVALDIDTQVLNVIAEHAERLRLPVETFEHNLCYDIPDELMGIFDTFVTEPPDTVDGIRLFVSRGVQLLRKETGRVGYCGVSTTACPPAGIVELNRSFVEMGLQISVWLPKFNEYPPVRTELKHIEVPDFYDPFYPPDKVWYISDLVRLKTTKSPKPLIEGEYKSRITDYEGDAARYR